MFVILYTHINFNNLSIVVELTPYSNGKINNMLQLPFKKNFDNHNDVIDFKINHIILIPVEKLMHYLVKRENL